MVDESFNADDFEDARSGDTSLDASRAMHADAGVMGTPSRLDATCVAFFSPVGDSATPWFSRRPPLETDAAEGETAGAESTAALSAVPARVLTLLDVGSIALDVGPTQPSPCDVAASPSPATPPSAAGGGGDTVNEELIGGVAAPCDSSAASAMLAIDAAASSSHTPATAADALAPSPSDAAPTFFSSLPVPVEPETTTAAAAAAAPIPRFIASMMSPLPEEPSILEAMQSPDSADVSQSASSTRRYFGVFGDATGMPRPALQPHHHALRPFCDEIPGAATLCAVGAAAGNDGDVRTARPGLPHLADACTRAGADGAAPHDDFNARCAALDDSLAAWQRDCGVTDADLDLDVFGDGDNVSFHGSAIGAALRAAADSPPTVTDAVASAQLLLTPPSDAVQLSSAAEAAASSATSATVAAAAAATAAAVQRLARFARRCLAVWAADRATAADMERADTQARHAAAATRIAALWRGWTARRRLQRKVAADRAAATAARRAVAEAAAATSAAAAAAEPTATAGVDAVELPVAAPLATAATAPALPVSHTRIVFGRTAFRHGLAGRLAAAAATVAAVPTTVAPAPVAVVTVASSPDAVAVQAPPAAPLVPAAAAQGAVMPPVAAAAHRAPVAAAELLQLQPEASAAPVEGRHPELAVAAAAAEAAAAAIEEDATHRAVVPMQAAWRGRRARTMKTAAYPPPAALILARRGSSALQSAAAASGAGIGGPPLTPKRGASAAAATPRSPTPLSSPFATAQLRKRAARALRVVATSRRLRDLITAVAEIDACVWRDPTSVAPLLLGLPAVMPALLALSRECGVSAGHAVLARHVYSVLLGIVACDSDAGGDGATSGAVGPGRAALLSTSQAAAALVDALHMFGHVALPPKQREPIAPVDVAAVDAAARVLVPATKLLRVLVEAAVVVRSTPAHDLAWTADGEATAAGATAVIGLVSSRGTRARLTSLHASATAVAVQGPVSSITAVVSAVSAAVASDLGTVNMLAAAAASASTSAHAPHQAFTAGLRGAGNASATAYATRYGGRGAAAAPMRQQL